MLVNIIMDKLVQLKDNNKNNLYPKLHDSQIPESKKYPITTFTTGATKEYRIPVISNRGNLIVGLTAMGPSYGICSELYYFFWNDNLVNTGLKKIADNSGTSTGDGTALSSHSFDKENKELVLTTRSAYTNGFYFGYVDTKRMV